MPSKPIEPKFEIQSPNILRELFKPEHLQRTIKRMRAWQESENEVTHPLRRAILLEYQEELSKGLGSAVPAGTWRPSAAYIILISKRSGTYREIVFPGLLDVIVGRHIIDALEPYITADDGGKVFCGRSHANAARQRGDYENWFQVWLDFSAAIGQALEAGGYTYVFDTDITDFFPTVNRDRAKDALAQRTQAHQSILELLFYCLESWVPRLGYCPTLGLPVEPNDVSRLIAHNYIKAVDEKFINQESSEYLRWVDDTVIFVPDERSAEDVKLRHHLALREMGLSPNASKTQIMSAHDFGESRHPDFNLEINVAKEAGDVDAIAELADRWFSDDPAKVTSWDKVAARLYSAARDLRSDHLLTWVIDHIAAFPRLHSAAFRYLIDYDLTAQQLGGLLAINGRPTATVETRMEIGRFLCDARLACDAQVLVNSAVGEIMSDDDRPGSGYAKSCFLLCLNKYGSRRDRKRISQWASVERLQDEQLRLHYFLCFLLLR
jgi:hypothetical protein